MEDKALKTEEEAEKFASDNKPDIEKYNDYMAAIEDGNPPELAEGEEPPSLPQFDSKYFMFGYDEEHPPIIIPAVIVDDTDNDWVISQDKKDELVTSYNEKIQESL